MLLSHISKKLPLFSSMTSCARNDHWKIFWMSGHREKNLTRVGSNFIFSNSGLGLWLCQLSDLIGCQKSKNGPKKVKIDSPTRAGTPYISQNLKYLKWQNGVYQSTQNFVLISEMYNFICLSIIFLKLWPFEGWKGPKIGISG